MDYFITLSFNNIALLFANLCISALSYFNRHKQQNDCLVSILYQVVSYKIVFRKISTAEINRKQKQKLTIKSVQIIYDIILYLLHKCTVYCNLFMFIYVICNSTFVVFIVTKMSYLILIQ